MIKNNTGRLVFSLALIAFAITIISLALQFPFRARIFPLIFAVPVLIMSLMQLFYDLPLAKFKQWFAFVGDSGVRVQKFDHEEESNEANAENSIAAFAFIRMFLWLILLAVGLDQIGYAALFFYVLVMTKIEAKRSWLQSILLALGTWLTIYVLFVWILQVNL